MKSSVSFRGDLLKSLSTAISLQKIIVDRNKKPVDYVFVKANPAFGKLLKCDVKKLEGKKASEIWPDIFRGKKHTWLKFYADVAIGGKIMSREFFSVISKKWLLVHAHSPKKNYFITEFHDITRIRNISEKLRVSEENYKKIVETSVEGIFEINKEQVIVYVNNRMSEMLGYKRHEILGKKFTDILYKEDIRDHELRMNKRRNGFHEEYERQLRRKDGKECRVHISAVPVLDKEKKFAGSFAMLTDITERDRAETELMRIQKKFTNLINDIPVGFYRSTPEGRFLDVNPALVNMLGYSDRDELMKVDIVKDLYVKPDERTDGVVYNPDFTEDVEIYRLKRKDGREIWVEDRCRYIRNNKGEIVVHEGLCQDITERKSAEDAVALSEKRLRQIIDLVPHFIFAKDVNGKFILVNKAVADAYGTTVEELTGKTDADFAKSDEEVIHFRKDDDDVIKSGKPKIVPEESITDSTGLTRKLNTAKIPFTFSGTSLPAILGVSVDISEIKNKEQALHESERRLYTLMSHLPGIAYRCKNDPQWTMEFISEGCLPLTGYSSEDIMYNRKLSFNDIIHPDDRQMIWDVVQENINLKKPYKLIYRIITSENEQKWVWEQGSGVFNPSGELIALEGFIADITESKNAEDELQKKEKLLRIFFDSPGVMRALVEISNDSMKIINVNNDLLEYLGKKPDEVLNKNFLDLGFSGSIIKIWIENCYKSKNSGKSVHFEYKGMKNDWISSTATFIEPTEHGILSTLVFRDISEKQHLFDELVKAKEKAEELSRIKSSFLANMSHELRTPMVGILGFSEILSNEIKNPELQEYANLIHHGGTRLMDTLNLILDLSLIEADKLNTIISNFDLIKEINDVLRLFRKTASRKNLSLGLISESDVFDVCLDKRLTRQVLNNLVNNAIKYTNAGSINVYVKEVSLNREKFAEIKVEDTGIGIPDNMKEIIWEEFRQVSEGYGRMFEGTGLGLSISKKFVEILGGKIFLEKTEVNKGTTFKILLPVKSAVTEQYDGITGADVYKEKKILLENMQKAKSHKILYVEDERSSIALVKAYLKNFCRLDVANNAAEAVEKVKNNRYSIILMDINLGIDIDGIQATQKIRLIPGYEKTPVVAITAFAMEKEKEEFLKKGCTHYISKPFEKHNFISVLNQIFEEQGL
jgi:PAS domain S-box-containing protein